MPSRVAEVMQFHGQNPPYYISMCFRSFLAFTLVSYKACVVFGPLFYVTQVKYLFIFLCFSHLGHTFPELLKKKKKNSVALVVHLRPRDL